MKVTWLGDFSLLFESENMRIVLDPAHGGAWLDKPIDVVLLTHEHEGHLNMKILSQIAESAEKPVCFLAPANAYNKIEKLGGANNYVMLNRHSVWSEGGVTFYTTCAEHNDRSAVGFIIDDGRKTYYASGDTLYNYDVIDDVLELVEDGVDVAFLPINGKRNNMNAKDAADFAYEIGAKCAVPVHWCRDGGVDPREFDFEDAKILEIGVGEEL